MKIQLKNVFLIACISLIQHHYAQSLNSNKNTPVALHGKLNVIGNKIVDQYNSAVSFAGTSFPQSNTGLDGEKFYNADIVSYLKKDWKVSIIRATMGIENNGGYLSDSNNKNRVKTIVEAAIAEGIYVIIDWHSDQAKSHEKEAIKFFKEMAKLYGKHPNIIYEIYNEPIQSSWSNDIKPYAEALISEIRAIDLDNLIIVGTPNHSQDVDVVSKNPITSNSNIVYSLHFHANNHSNDLRIKAKTALKNGIALMVTEWGTASANGNGTVNYDSINKWMDFLEENHISHLNWSVNNKNETVSIAQPNTSEKGNWTDTDLTESGTYVQSIIRTWDKYENNNTKYSLKNTK